MLAQFGLEQSVAPRRARGRLLRAVNRRSKLTLLQEPIYARPRPLAQIFNQDTQAPTAHVPAYPMANMLRKCPCKSIHID
jgi:hypothetical protein